MLFSHVINPFVARPDSEHEFAQRVTWTALERALDEAKRADVAVEVLAAIYPADAPAVRPCAVALPHLTTRVSDLLALDRVVPLPLCADVLRLAHEHGRGEYVVFTNMDICPQPYFYRALARMIGGRRDAAFVIPRRTIPARFTSAEQLPEMIREPGAPHEGFECFVFPRVWIDRLDLAQLCLGIPGFDLMLILNLEALTNFHTAVLWNQFLTFHIGDDKSWSGRSELNAHNDTEARTILARLEQRLGKIPARSKFEYIRTWLLREPPPPAPLPVRVLRKAQQQFAECRNRRLVRAFRRELKLDS